MTKKEFQELQRNLIATYRESLTPFCARPKGRGNLSKRQLETLVAGFADGCVSMRTSLIASGALKLEEG